MTTSIAGQVFYVQYGDVLVSYDGETWEKNPTCAWTTATAMRVIRILSDGYGGLLIQSSSSVSV